MHCFCGVAWGSAITARARRAARRSKKPPSESTTPPALPGDAAKPDKPLSNELKENEGVLEPPKSLDNEIVRKAPVPEPNTTPVIPPPGAPGGDPNVKPK